MNEKRRKIEPPFEPDFDGMVKLRSELSAARACLLRGRRVFPRDDQRADDEFAKAYEGIADLREWLEL